MEQRVFYGYCRADKVSGMIDSSTIFSSLLPMLSQYGYIVPNSINRTLFDIDKKMDVKC